ncbi:hypothetical protein ScPMuIL_016001 [Solemya velum]
MHRETTSGVDLCSAPLAYSFSVYENHQPVTHHETGWTALVSLGLWFSFNPRDTSPTQDSSQRVSGSESERTLCRFLPVVYLLMSLQHGWHDRGSAVVCGGTEAHIVHILLPPHTGLHQAGMAPLWACVNVGHQSSLPRARRGLTDILDELYGAFGSKTDDTDVNQDVEKTETEDNSPSASESNTYVGSEDVPAPSVSKTYIGSEDTINNNGSQNDNGEPEIGSNSQNWGDTNAQDLSSSEVVNDAIIDNGGLVPSDVVNDTIIDNGGLIATDADTGNSPAADDVQDSASNSVFSQMNEFYGQVSSTSTTTDDWDWDDDEWNSYEPPCFNDRYLNESCAVSPSLKDVSFWDMYSLIFSDTVIDGLYMNCGTGDWCLDNDPGFWYTLIAERAEEFGNANVSSAVCDEVALECIRNIADNYTQCEEYPRMKLIAQATELLCQLEIDGLDVQNCDLHVFAALHVSMADLGRTSTTDSYDEYWENEPNSEVDTDCSTPEAKMSKTFACVNSSCQNYINIISGFEKWEWFLGDFAKYADKCDFADTLDCLNITVVDVTDAPGDVDYDGFASNETMEEIYDEIEEMLDEEVDNLFTYGTTTEPITRSTETITEEQEDQLENESANGMQENNRQLVTGDEAERKAIPGMWVNPSDKRVMVGVALATVMTICGLTIVGVMCWRKKLRMKKMKSGYEQLLSEENYED